MPEADPMIFRPDDLRILHNRENEPVGVEKGGVQHANTPD
jgi:hypothetical protein